MSRSPAFLCLLPLGLLDAAALLLDLPGGPLHLEPGVVDGFNLGFLIWQDGHQEAMDSEVGGGGANEMPHRKKQT